MVVHKRSERNRHFTDPNFLWYALIAVIGICVVRVRGLAYKFSLGYVVFTSLSLFLDVLTMDKRFVFLSRGRAFWDERLDCFARKVLCALALLSCAASAGCVSPHTEKATANSIGTAAATRPVIPVRLALQNPGFESANLSGWRSFQHAGDKVYKYEVVPGEAPEGRFSARITQSAPQFYGAIAQTIPAHGGRTYRLTAKLMSVNAVDRGWRMSAVCEGMPSGVEEFQAPPLLGSNAWSDVNIVFTAPPGTTSVRVLFALGGIGEGWVDDVRLEQLN